MSYLCRDLWGPSYIVGARPIFFGATPPKLAPLTYKFLPTPYDHRKWACGALNSMVVSFRFRLTRHKVGFSTALCCAVENSLLLADWRRRTSRGRWRHSTRDWSVTSHAAVDGLVNGAINRPIFTAEHADYELSKHTTTIRCDRSTNQNPPRTFLHRIRCLKCIFHVSAVLP